MLAWRHMQQIGWDNGLHLTVIDGRLTPGSVLGILAFAVAMAAILAWLNDDTGSAGELAASGAEPEGEG